VSRKFEIFFDDLKKDCQNFLVVKMEIMMHFLLPL